MELRKNKTNFDEDNVGTKEYDLEATGKVKIRIDAKKHQGSFSFTSK